MLLTINYKNADGTHIKSFTNTGFRPLLGEEVSFASDNIHGTVARIVWVRLNEVDIYFA